MRVQGCRPLTLETQRDAADTQMILTRKNEGHQPENTLTDVNRDRTENYQVPSLLINLSIIFPQ